MNPAQLDYAIGRVAELEAENSKLRKECVAAAGTFLEAGRRSADLSKCSDGHAHVLYAIESGGWVEEVGCERCTFKVIAKEVKP